MPVSIDAARDSIRGNGIELRTISTNRRDAISSLLASAGVVLAPGIVRAQAVFPNRPIRIVVPVSPGGGVDTFARLIAAKVKTQRDVQFFVENRTGGNSTIGGLDVQRAAPDGYTVLFHASTHNVARLVMRNVPYDPVADFTPIALAGSAPLVHIVSNNRQEKTLAELVDVWEAANRDDLFSVTSLKHYPYVANSDFHKPKHLYSWKTLLKAEKNWDSIATALRANVDVALTLFRNGSWAA